MIKSKQHTLKFGKQVDPPFFKLTKINCLTSVLVDFYAGIEKHWIPYKNGINSDIYINPPEEFLEAFEHQFWDWTGFAATKARAYLEPHEDEGIDENGCLSVVAGRTCAIFFPISGEFSQVPINFHPIENPTQIVESLYLDIPSLVITKNPYLHSVDNRINQERIFFCLNFNPPKSHVDVIEWLNREGKI